MIYQQEVIRRLGVRGVDRNWNGGNGTFYHSGGLNWTPVGNPASTDNAYIVVNGSKVISADPVDLNALEMGSYSFPFTTPEVILQQELFTFYLDMGPYSTLYLINNTFQYPMPSAIALSAKIYGNIYFDGQFSLYSYNLEITSWSFFYFNDFGIFGLGWETELSGVLYISKGASVYAYNNFTSYGNIYSEKGSTLFFQDLTFFDYHAPNNFNGYSRLDLDGSHLKVWKSVNLNDNTTFNLVDTDAFILDSVFNLNHNSKLIIEGISPALSNNSIFTMRDNSNMVMYNPTPFSLTNISPSASNSMLFTIFTLHNHATLTMNHTLLLLQALDFSLNDNSLIYMKNQSMLLILNDKNSLNDNSRIDIDNSTMAIFTNNASVIQSNYSSINLYGDRSMMVIGGLHLFRDKSNLTLSGNSQLIINGSLVQQDNSSLVAFSSIVYVNGLCMMKDKTMAYFGDYSSLLVEGTATFLGTSNLYLYYSYIYIPGNLGVGSSITAYQSRFIVKGEFFSKGLIRCDACSILQWEGRFDSFGIGYYLNSNITIEGDANFGDIFFSENTNITVSGGNLKIFSQSYFNCTFCNIIIINGQFLYDGNSSINLYGTTFINTGGEIQSSGNLYVHTGSQMKNDGIFNLASNIYKASNETDTVLLNTGNFNSIQNGNSKEITIPILNEGTFNVENDNLYISQISQRNGVLNLKNAYLETNETIENGGFIQGNGTIQSSIQNSGSFGSNKTIDQLKVNGNFTQLPNGTIIITIFSAQDFSQLNISDIATLNGSVIIRISQDFSSDDVNRPIPVINYQASSGSFSNVQFKTFNPKTGQDTKSDDCGHQVQSSKNSFSVLVSTGCSNGKKKLPVGLVVGVVIGCAAAVILGFLGYRYRHRIFKDYRTKTGLFKLRRLSLKKSISASKS